MKTGLFNAGLRTAGLGCRFVLSMFMARFMTLGDVGTFVLMTGVTGLAPSIFGFGLNYFLNRELVGMPHDQAVAVTQDRLVTSLVCGLVAALLLWLFRASLPRDVPVAVCAAIVGLEILSLDQQMALLGRFRTTLANFLLFLRAGAWTVPFMVLAFLRPEFRTMNTVSWFWLGGLVLSQAVLAAMFARDSLHSLRSLAGWRARFARKVGWRFWKIYLSDLGLAGSVYIDRFIVGALAGVSAAGAYFFFVSIVNSVYVIVSAATLQVYRQELRLAYMQHGLTAMHTKMIARLRSTIVVTVGALAAAGPTTYVAALLTKKQALIDVIGVLPILLAAYLLRIISDFLANAISMTEQDMAFAAFNLAGLVATVVACAALTPVLGLYGAAIASLLVSGGLVWARWSSWQRFYHRQIAAGAAVPEPARSEA